MRHFLICSFVYYIAVRSTTLVLNYSYTSFHFRCPLHNHCQLILFTTHFLFLSLNRFVCMVIFFPDILFVFPSVFLHVSHCKDNSPFTIIQNTCYSFSRFIIRVSSLQNSYSTYLQPHLKWYPSFLSEFFDIHHFILFNVQRPYLTTEPTSAFIYFIFVFRMSFTLFKARDQHKVEC